jgi:hypothetical protein
MHENGVTEVGCQELLRKQLQKEGWVVVSMAAAKQHSPPETAPQSQEKAKGTLPPSVHKCSHWKERKQNLYWRLYDVFLGKLAIILLCRRTFAFAFLFKQTLTIWMELYDVVNNFKDVMTGDFYICYCWICQERRSRQTNAF